MLRLLRLRQRDHLDQKHYDCVLCGKSSFNYELDFYSGSGEPDISDVLTGATSAKTGTVLSVALVGGAWADGDAHGTIIFASGTGSSDFTVDETVDNTTFGLVNVMTVRASTQRRRGGRRYPKKFISVVDGKNYCTRHARWVGHTGDKNTQDVEEDD
jgi:hypothetical protein